MPFCAQTVHYLSNSSALSAGVQLVALTGGQLSGSWHIGVRTAVQVPQVFAC